VVVTDSSLVKRICEIEGVVKEIKSVPSTSVGTTKQGPTYAEILKQAETKLIKKVKTDINYFP
jgi:hypothetical protein